MNEFRKLMESLDSIANESVGNPEDGRVGRFDRYALYIPRTKK